MGDVGLVALLVAAFLLVIGLVRLVETLTGTDLPVAEAGEQPGDDGYGGHAAGPGNDNPLEPM